MPRLKAPSFKTRAEFEAAINKIAELEVQARKLAARRDARVQAVQDEFAPAETALQKEKDALLAQAEKYADEHRDDLFTKERKSAETPLATYGHRCGNPTLSLLNRNWTWDQVVKVLSFSKWRDTFIRTTPTIDKDAVKAANLPAEDLASVGLKITQSETFYIEPKLDGAELVKAEAAR